MIERLTKLIDRAKKRIEIVQSSYKSEGSHQTQNIYITLRSDRDLEAILAEVVDLSSANEKAFQQITDYLQEVDTENLTGLQRDLLTTWLRRTVAENHIAYGRSRFHDRNFQILMLDTSFIDQPARCWVEHPDFLKVVAEDGLLATAYADRGKSNRVFRVFFVESGEQLYNISDYVVETIKMQVERNITACLSRADLAKLQSPDLVSDCFCIPGQVVCAIDKPFWKFELHRDKATVNDFEERVRTVAKADYSAIITKNEVLRIDDIVLELATI